MFYTKTFHSQIKLALGDHRNVRGWKSLDFCDSISLFKKRMDDEEAGYSFLPDIGGGEETGVEGFEPP